MSVGLPEAVKSALSREKIPAAGLAGERLGLEEEGVEEGLEGEGLEEEGEGRRVDRVGGAAPAVG